MIFDVFISPFAFCGISNTITKYTLKKTHSGLEKWGETGEETIDSKTHGKKKGKKSNAKTTVQDGEEYAESLNRTAPFTQSQVAF